MTRPLRVGDRVTATGTVVSIGHGYTNVKFDGASLVNSFDPTDACFTLIAPAEPPVGSVVVKDGVAWVRRNRDWFCFESAGDHAVWTGWDDLSDGDVIFTPGGDA